MNSLFNLSKVKMTADSMKAFDDFFSDKLEAFKDKIDYFSVLHLIINALKNTHDIRVRYNMKSTIRFILTQLSSIDPGKYAEIGTNKDKMEKFQRIVQFISLISTETSLNHDLTALHYSAIEKVVQVIKLMNVSTQNSKNLAFMISCFGKTSLQDEIVLELRNAIYAKFKEGKANIFDIVETFNTMMSLNLLTSDDLKQTGLDKNYIWAEELSSQPKIALQLRYFEILAIADIQILPLWESFLQNLAKIDLNSLNIFDLS